MQLTSVGHRSPMVTIVSGGTQGLGEAVARKLAADGAAGLVLAGRSARRGRRAWQPSSAGLGTPTVFVPRRRHRASDAPRRDRRHVRPAVRTPCTGSSTWQRSRRRANLFQDDPTHFDRMMIANVRAPYFLIQASARLMLATNATGSIVNVGSTAGHGGQTKLSAYSISKGALATMTRNLAFGLLRHGIRVNQVNPGWMETESEHRTQVDYEGAPENWLELAAPRRPLGRLVQPWEVARTRSPTACPRTPG